MQLGPFVGFLTVGTWAVSDPFTHLLQPIPHAKSSYSVLKHMDVVTFTVIRYVMFVSIHGRGAFS